MCRQIVLAGLMALVWSSGCARLEPRTEPEGADFRVTVDSLKSAVRDSQRTTADLRIELADRRKELADVHVARAQLQGMLRETEHRLAEARRVIELQREELVAAQVDRGRIEESGRQLHSRLRRLEKLLAQARKRKETGGEVIPSGYERGASSELLQSVHISPPGFAVAAQPVMATEALAADPLLIAADVPQTDREAPRLVVVRKGETLWRLARKHGVDLEELRQVNGLQDNHIVMGWTLRLPASARAAGIQASGSRRMAR